MAAEMEQQRAPELAEPESSPRPESTTSTAKVLDESKPVADAAQSGLAWPDAGLQPLKTRPTTPGGSSLKVETSAPVVQASSAALGEVLEEPKPSDGLPMPNMSCDSVAPVSPTVMKDLQFDSRFISDAWSYEAPQNMYALLTQPTSQLDPLAGGTGLVTPYMQLQAQQQQLLQQQQQLEQQLEHGLPLQMSPIHGSGLSALYMSGAPLSMSPHQMMMQQPPNTSGVGSGYPTTPTAVSLGDIMISGDPSMFLGPSGSPTNLVKQHMIPPMPHSGGVINVKELTLNELRPHFNKPMAVVAKELGVCITLMKKICRRNGLVRWPHRRIRSLVNRITSLQVLAGNATGAERKRFQGQIAGLREELSAVIQNPNEKSRKAQPDINIPVLPEQLVPNKVKDEFPIAQITDEMVGPEEIRIDDENNNRESETSAPKRGKKKKSNVTIKTEMKDKTVVASDTAVQNDKSSGGTRTKKRKPTFGLHAHQPPPIKIPRHDELPSISRLRSQSVPERRLRGDRRYGRGRDTGAGTSTTCLRPSTTTHRNGRRGSISSILNDIPE